MFDYINNPAMTTFSPPPGIMISDHFNESFGYGAHRPQGTRDWLIIFTLEGCGEYQLHGQTHQCSSGDILILSPGTPHHYYVPLNKHWEFFWAHFMPEIHLMELLQFQDVEIGCTHMSIQSTHLIERLQVAFQRLIKDNKQNDSFHIKLSMNAVEEILTLLASHTQKPANLDPRIEDTLHHLSNHLKSQHTISSLAIRIQLSPSHFAHLFKKQTGDSVMETLLKLRLNHAAKLLEHTVMQIREVADEVGFQSPFYFTKQFTSYYGQSPSKFRTHVQKNSH